MNTPEEQSSYHKRGHLFMKKVAKLLSPFFEVRIGVQNGQVLESDVTGVPDAWIECKCGASPESSPRHALQQAERDLRNLWRVPLDVCTSHTPVAVCATSLRRRPIVSMYLDDWVRLYLDALSWRKLV